MREGGDHLSDVWDEAIVDDLEVEHAPPSPIAHAEESTLSQQLTNPARIDPEAGGRLPGGERSCQEGCRLGRCLGTHSVVGFVVGGRMQTAAAKLTRLCAGGSGHGISVGTAPARHGSASRSSARKGVG
jgi:hypothetical protein